jgi:hypothetical protein
MLPEQPISDYRPPEKNTFVLAMSDLCTESRMQEILGVNPKSWNDLKNQGILPRSGTNGEFLVKIFRYYKDKEAVALARVVAANESAAERKSRYKTGDTESGLPRVVEGEKLQKIRLDRARETEVHLKNKVTRGLLIDKKYLLDLVSPLISNIANVLRAAADENPTIQPIIDKCFISLSNTGEALCKQADIDSEQYVQEMMSKQVDLDALIANTELDTSLETDD